MGHCCLVDTLSDGIPAGWLAPPSKTALSRKLMQCFCGKFSPLENKIQNKNLEMSRVLDLQSVVLYGFSFYQTQSIFCAWTGGINTFFSANKHRHFTEKPLHDQWRTTALRTFLWRWVHRSPVRAAAIKGPSPATLNVFRSQKVLPAESITYSSDLRSEDGGGRRGRRGWANRRRWVERKKKRNGQRGGGGGGGGFTVTKCRGQAGCVVGVLISEASGAHVARTLTLK